MLLVGFSQIGALNKHAPLVFISYLENNLHKKALHIYPYIYHISRQGCRYTVVNGGEQQGSSLNGNFAETSTKLILAATVVNDTLGYSAILATALQQIFIDIKEISLILNFS